jgi:hypothetical protein
MPVNVIRARLNSLRKNLPTQEVEESVVTAEKKEFGLALGKLACFGGSAGSPCTAELSHSYMLSL